jgi:hypothetical protein
MVRTQSAELVSINNQGVICTHWVARKIAIVSIILIGEIVQKCFHSSETAQQGILCNRYLKKISKILCFSLIKAWIEKISV